MLNPVLCIALLLLMIAPVVAAAGVLTRAFFGERDFAEKVVVFLCFFSALVVVSTAGAGFTGALRVGALIGIGFVVLIAVLIAWKWLNNGSETGAKSDKERFSTPLTISCVVVFAALLVAFLWSAAAPPPPWDSFVYHLTFPARWIQEGKIFLITVPFGDQAGTYFPSNTELLYSFLMLPLREEFLTSLVQFTFLVGIGFLTMKIAEGAGCSRGSAAGAGLLAVVVPEMLHQSVAPETDLAFAFFFLASLHFVLLSIRNNGSLRDFIAACVAFGLLAGTKYIALVFGAPLLPLFIIAIMRGRAGWRLAGMAAICLATGGFWYVRNWLVTGNPVFPLSLSLFGAEIFPGGYPRSTMMGSVFHSNDPLEFFTVMRDVAGAPMLAALGAGILLGAVAMKKSGRKGLSAVYPAVLPFVIFLIFEFAVPYNREGRFTFAAFALLAVFFAHAMDAPGVAGAAMKWLHPAAVAGVVISNEFIRTTSANVILSLNGANNSNLVLYGMCMPMRYALAVALFVIGAAHLKMTRPPSPDKVKIIKFFTVFKLVLAVATFYSYLVFTEMIYSEYRPYYYTGFPIGEAWSEFQKNAPAGATVAFTGTDLSFGLFGARLNHRVVYANVGPHGDWHFHDFVRALKAEGRWRVPPNDRINFHREDADYGAWLANLRAAGADYLFAAVLHQTDRGQIPHDAEFFPVERGWADAHPEKFTLLFSNSQVKIYKVLQK